jgi:hypothetical protein
LLKSDFQGRSDSKNIQVNWRPNGNQQWIFADSDGRDRKHYISHAATMFAILAFHSCGEPL